MVARVCRADPLNVIVPELLIKVPELAQLPETLKLPPEVGAVKVVETLMLTEPVDQTPASRAPVLIVPPLSVMLVEVKETEPKSASAAPALINAPVLTEPAKVAAPELVMLNVPLIAIVLRLIIPVLVMVTVLRPVASAIVPEP